MRVTWEDMWKSVYIREKLLFLFPINFEMYPRDQPVRGVYF